MAWARFDDNCFDHPKVAALDDATHRVWFNSVLQSSRHHKTEGFLSDAVVGRVLHASAQCRGLLVGVGLWDIAEGGIQIHNWEKYQPKGRKSPAELSEIRAEAGKKGAAKREANRMQTAMQTAKQEDTKSSPVPVPVPVPVEDIEEADPVDVKGPLEEQPSLPTIPPKLTDKQQTDADVAKVWAHLRKLDPSKRARCGKDQDRKIRARLKNDSSADDLILCATGCYSSDWHHRTGNLGLGYIFRSRELVEKGMRIAAPTSPTPATPSSPTPPSPERAALEDLGASYGLPQFSRPDAEFFLGFGLDRLKSELDALTNDGVDPCRTVDLRIALEMHP